MMNRDLRRKLCTSAAVLAIAALIFSGCSGTGSNGNSGSNGSSGSDGSSAGSNDSDNSDSDSGEGSQSVIYEDMKEAYDDSGLMSSNIGIFTRTESDGEISYGNGGSGVIIEKENGYYYALTAAHVADTETGQLLVFTVNTEMEGEEIPGMEDVNILSQDTYDSMLEAEAVFISDENDVAVIRFATEEELACVELAEEDPAVGDRILCIGNPENDWFAFSCGEITSEPEAFGELDGYPSNAMKHSAYIQVGSSGGAAIGEEMTLVGITPGASFSLDGTIFEYGVVIPVSEIRSSLEGWEK